MIANNLSPLTQTEMEVIAGGDLYMVIGFAVGYAAGRIEQMWRESAWEINSGSGTVSVVSR